MNASNPESKITGGPTKLLFSAKVLGRHEVSYFRCEQTGFIQCEDPYWLEEAYDSAITKLDIGLLERNLRYSSFTSEFIDKHRPTFHSGLDFAGGYGLFTRRMRDLGYAFYTHDPHCSNIFAEHFNLADSPTNRFDVVTAFEVMEHVVEPRELIQELFSHSDTILFSTQLVPSTPIHEASDWWYFVPEVGQHISFFTLASLQHLADELHLNCFTNGSNLHLFTRETSTEDPFQTPPRKKESMLQRLLMRLSNKRHHSDAPPPRPSLTQTDFEYVRSLIQ